MFRKFEEVALGIKKKHGVEQKKLLNSNWENGTKWEGKCLRVRKKIKGEGRRNLKWDTFFAAQKCFLLGWNKKFKAWK